MTTSSDKPTPEAFLKSLQSIERVQAKKQPVIRSAQLRPEVRNTPGYPGGWFDGEGGNDDAA